MTRAVAEHAPDTVKQVAAIDARLTDIARRRADAKQRIRDCEAGILQSLIALDNLQYDTERLLDERLAARPA